MRNPYVPSVKAQEDKWLNLMEAKSIFHDLDVTFFLSNGTLLGFHREEDFIWHDPDIDVGVFASEPTINLSPMLERFRLAGFDLYREYGNLHLRNTLGYQLSFHRREIKFDIFFYVEDQNPQTGDWFSWMPVYEGSKSRERMHKYIFPSLDLGAQWFRGHRFYVPAPVKDFLVAQYGEDWEIPVKEWSYLTSPHNIVRST